MNRKFISSLSMLLVLLLTASCVSQKQRAAAENTVMNFVDALKSGDTKLAESFCYNEFKEDAVSYSDKAVQAAAMSFPEFLRDDRTTLFNEKTLPEIDKLLTASIKSTEESDNGLILTVSFDTDETFPEPVLTSDEINTMVTTAFTTDPIENIITDYAFIKHMSFSDLMMKYSATTQEQLISDICADVSSQNEIFAQNIHDSFVREAKFYLEEVGGIWKIISVD